MSEEDEKLLSDTTDTKTRSRGWVFTLNNYTEEERQALLNHDCKYIIIAKEVAKTGTPHLQGFVYYHTVTSFRQLKKLNGRMYVAQQKGTCKQAADYCRNPIKCESYEERGTEPLTQVAKGDEEVKRWKRMRTLAQEGKMDQLGEEFPREATMYDRQFEHLHLKKKPKPAILPLLECEWLVGSTGTGKSRTAREENPGAYIKDPQSRWWDDYEGEETVIIDDFDKYQKAMGGYMKTWTDHYPFKAEVKRGYIYIRPKKIIVTSNYRIEEIWGDDPQTVKPLLRRFTVREFDPPPSPYHPMFNHPDLP